MTNKKNNNEEIVMSFDVPEGYEIDRRKSNFRTGKIVYVPLNFTMEDVIDNWNANKKEDDKHYQKVKDYMYSGIPSSCSVLYDAIVIRSFFNSCQKIPKDNLTKGKYIIDNQTNTYRNLLEEEKHIHPKGSIIFNSLEEAKFVDMMMKKYCNKLCSWSEI